MVITRTTIGLKEGVAVEILVTPSLYGVAKRRGIDLTSAEMGNTEDVLALYERIVYCAAINAWEVAQVDDPAKGAFPYTFADIHEWAWADGRKAFLEVVKFIAQALSTGEKKKG